MTLQGAARVGVWLTAAALLWAACDVLENKKFPPPNPPGGGTTINPGGTRPTFGVGGGKGDGTGGYGGYYGGYGGYGGFGGFGGRALRPDAGTSGLAGAPGGIACAFTGDGCVVSCYADNAFVGAPFCDTTRGAWICPPGLVLTSSCPAGACATTFLFCCDTVTGAREPAGCTQGGYRAQCSTMSYNTLTEDACIPDRVSVMNCIELRGQYCPATDLQCHSGPYDCYCVPGPAGLLVWSCPGPV